MSSHVDPASRVMGDDSHSPLADLVHVDAAAGLTDQDRLEMLSRIAARDQCSAYAVPRAQSEAGVGRSSEDSSPSPKSPPRPMGRVTVKLVEHSGSDADLGDVSADGGSSGDVAARRDSSTGSGSRASAFECATTATVVSLVSSAATTHTTATAQLAAGPTTAGAPLKSALKSTHPSQSTTGGGVRLCLRANGRPFSTEDEAAAVIQRAWRRYAAAALHQRRIGAAIALVAAFSPIGGLSGSRESSFSTERRDGDGGDVSGSREASAAAPAQVSDVSRAAPFTAAQAGALRRALTLIEVASGSSAATDALGRLESALKNSDTIRSYLFAPTSAADPTVRLPSVEDAERLLLAASASGRHHHQSTPHMPLSTLPQRLRALAAAATDLELRLHADHLSMLLVAQARQHDAVTGRGRPRPLEGSDVLRHRHLQWNPFAIQRRVRPVAAADIAEVAGNLRGAMGWPDTAATTIISARAPAAVSAASTEVGTSTDDLGSAPAQAEEPEWVMDLLHPIETAHSWGSYFFAAPMPSATAVGQEEEEGPTADRRDSDMVEGAARLSRGPRYDPMHDREQQQLLLSRQVYQAQAADRGGELPHAAATASAPGDFAAGNSTTTTPNEVEAVTSEVAKANAMMAALADAAWERAAASRMAGRDPFEPAEARTHVLTSEDEEILANLGLTESVGAAIAAHDAALAADDRAATDRVRRATRFLAETTAASLAAMTASAGTEVSVSTQAQNGGATSNAGEVPLEVLGSVGSSGFVLWTKRASTANAVQVASTARMSVALDDDENNADDAGAAALPPAATEATSAAAAAAADAAPVVAPAAASGGASPSPLITRGTCDICELNGSADEPLMRCVCGLLFHADCGASEVDQVGRPRCSAACIRFR